MRRHAYLLAAVALLVVAGQLGRDVDARRRRHALAPPGGGPTAGTFAGSFALAGFRPLAVNALWIKAGALTRQKRWWELRPTFALLAQLQPHNPRVWVFNAWNMAYNIPVEMPSNADRWRWIEQGLAFTAEGLERNPGAEDIELFRAQILHHKLWSHPSLWPRLERSRGARCEELARDAIEPAWRREPHHPQVALMWRAQLLRRALLAAARDGDLDATRGWLARIDADTARIRRLHPGLRMALQTPRLRELLLRAGMTWQLHVVDGLRAEYREDLLVALDDRARRDARWAAVVEAQRQVVRTWRLLEGVLDGERAHVGRVQLKPVETPLEALLALGALVAERQRVDDWRRFAAAQRVAAAGRLAAMGRLRVWVEALTPSDTLAARRALVADERRIRAAYDARGVRDPLLRRLLDSQRATPVW